MALAQLHRQQAREDRVARVGRGGRQDRAVVLAPDVEVLLEQRLEREPLVEAHAVDHDEDHAAALLERRHHGVLHHVGREHGTVGGARHPVRVVILDEAPEVDVEAAPEVLVRLLEAGLRHLVEAHVPARHVGGQLRPCRPVEPAQVEALPALHLAHVVAGALRVLELLGVEHALAGQEHLGGVHGLDQVVRDRAPDRLVHERLLLALGDQDHRHPEVARLDLVEGLQPPQPRHHLVQQHEVVAPAPELGQGVLAVGDGRDAEALLLQELDVRAQQLDLVVRPQDVAAMFFRHGDLPGSAGPRGG